MKTLYMTKGLPASGKTTAAKALVATQPMTKRVNKDDTRAMLDCGKWSEANEKFILSVRDHVIEAALTDGYHIIVDDTNFAPKHEAHLRGLAKFHTARFEIMDFTHVPLEVCLRRDLERPKSVGPKVITDMWEKYLMVPPPAPPEANPRLPVGIICDIDGTIAQMVPGGRGPFDWAQVGEDLPRHHVMRAVRALASQTDAKILFVSGRDEACRKQTSTWLWENFKLSYLDYLLFMRPAGDSRRDSIVKREIYETFIKPFWNVDAIFDDRPQVIRECWQALGFGDRLFNVGSGKEF